MFLNPLYVFKANGMKQAAQGRIYVLSGVSFFGKVDELGGNRALGLQGIELRVVCAGWGSDWPYNASAITRLVSQVAGGCYYAFVFGWPSVYQPLSQNIYVFNFSKRYANYVNQNGRVHVFMIYC